MMLPCKILTSKIFLGWHLAIYEVHSHLGLIHISFLSEIQYFISFRYYVQGKVR